MTFCGTNKEHSPFERDSVVRCAVYPAAPARASRLASLPCETRVADSPATLANGFLAVEIDRGTGVIVGLTNRLTGRRHDVADDDIGCQWWTDRNRIRRWTARSGGVGVSDTAFAGDGDCATAAFTTRVDDMTVVICYRLRRRAFWLERRLEIHRPGGIHLDRLILGRLIPAGCRAHKELALGRFDRPRLFPDIAGAGGLFTGVAWWFYDVDCRGTYQNADMDYRANELFESEAWYAGVFAAEPGDPYPGWAWYKTFLEQRKAEHDRQPSWSYWNLGWGQMGAEVDTQHARPCLELARRLGLRSLLFGSGGYGKGVPGYIQAARENETARSVLRDMKAYGMVAGVLEKGDLKSDWQDRGVIERKLSEMDRFADAGWSAFHFDFFATVDTYTAHRNVTAYFRAARERLAYTECHLGMAAYGPQFQMEALLNHPTDTQGFDISPFSSDWATFLSFRHSRAGWQERYDYLMPEYGLYYYVTHYGNVCGEQRRYTDPEPQQFLTVIPAYTGIAFNFHDTIGYRSALMAASAFSPYYVFGRLDPRMPDADVRFTRRMLEWVAAHADVLRPARVCHEDASSCVVSKVVNGRGLVYALNYAAGRRTFELTLNALGDGPLKVRRIWPAPEPESALENNKHITLEIPGESLVVWEINGALRGMPPENAGSRSIDISEWSAVVSGMESRFALPQILPSQPEPDAPRFLVSIEETGVPAHPLKAACGRLPDAFRKAHGFRDDSSVAAWRFAPWAFPDRAWLVWRPAAPLRMTEPWPEAALNGVTLEWIPRVDYRYDNIEEWRCAILFADITEKAVFGGRNILAVAAPSERCLGTWRVIASETREIS